MNRILLVCAALLGCILPGAYVHAQAPREATQRDRAAAREGRTRRARTPRAPRAQTRRSRESPATARITLERAGTAPSAMRVTVAVEGPGVWELAADNRMLSFEVTPVAAEPAPNARRRPRRVRALTCRHPNAARRVDPEHVARTPATWTEPLDLRMYCFGRAYEALLAGGSLVPVYGVKRASAKAYLARSVDDASLRPLASVRGEAFVPFPRAGTQTETPAEESGGPGVTVGLVPTDSTAPGAPALHAYLRATRAVRLYMRDDLVSFRITDPAGRVAECAPPRTVIVPIIDFWKRLSRGGRIDTTTDAARYCGEIFREPGIYEVIPRLELPYSGERFQIDAVTGTFTGAPSYVRVRPQRGRYVVPRT